MANIKSKWTEETWAAHCQRTAQEKAARREKRAKLGVEREPAQSLWALGIAHGREILEEHPGQVAEALTTAKRIADAPFVYREGDGAKALALHERKLAYYEGMRFALEGGRMKAAMFAAPKAPTLKELLPV